MTKESRFGNRYSPYFPGLKRLTGVAAVVGILAGCGVAPKEPTEISVTELAAATCKGDDNNIYEVAGQIRKIGERSYYRSLPYIKPSGGVGISLSRVVQTTYKLQEVVDPALPAVTVIDKTGGTYLPLPIVSAQGSDYENAVIVNGSYQAIEGEDHQEQCVLVANNIAVIS